MKKTKEKNKTKTKFNYSKMIKYLSIGSIIGIIFGGISAADRR